MADFHVDVGTGDDSNVGTAVSPVRTITQAINLAAASPDTTGTIFVAAGTYEPPNESFPLLVRPGYALQGAGRDRTLIRFTGEARTISGTTTTYWGGTAIQVGSAVRDLTLRAHPVPPGYECSGMIGIVAIEDGAVIEHADVLGPQLPEEYPGGHGVPYGEEQRTFLVSVLIEGADVTYRNSVVRHGGPVGVVRGGASLLEGLRLEAQHGPLFLASDARVQHCLFLFRSLGFAAGTAGPGVSINGGHPTIGPGNRFGMSSHPNIDCYGGAVVAIVANIFASYHRSDMFQANDGIDIRDGASAQVIGNFLGGGSIHVQSDAAPYSLFDDNVFYSRIRVEVPTDFGSGPAGSHGGNHFGPLGENRLDWPASLAAEGICLDARIPGGGDVHAADNFWSHGRPNDQTMPAAGTRVIATRPRIDPLTPEDTHRRWMTLMHELWGA